MDTRVRTMAGELYAAIKNDADAKRAKRMVQWLEFAMGSSFRAMDVGEVRHVMKRRAEEAARKRARVEAEKETEAATEAGAPVSGVGDVADSPEKGKEVETNGNNIDKTN